MERRKRWKKRKREKIKTNLRGNENENKKEIIKCEKLLPIERKDKKEE